MDLEAKQARFARLCGELYRSHHASGAAGIGTLGEKRMHVLIKRYICEDEDLHEVGVAGTRYVSDVRIGNEIYEVQTGAFYPMKSKIAHYLERTDCTVTVVHPVSLVQWLSWIDKETGEITPPKKVSRHGRAEDLLAELYCLLPYVRHPRLRVRLLFLETQDFRYLNGKRSRDRKRGAEKYERLPLSLIDEWELSSPSDYARFLPDGLPEEFTVKEFSDATKIRGRDAYSAVRVLCALGLLTQGQGRGRSMTFCR